MNTCIIILGVTGDLARRKLIPALYYLYRTNQFTWVGVAHDTTTIADLVHRACDQLSDLDNEVLQNFIKAGTYCQMSLTQAADYSALKQLINQQALGPRLFYYALPSDLYCTVTQNLFEHAILERQEHNLKTWHRCVFEKPFGHNWQSARELDTCLAAYLTEHQIWRVDHYLCKEIIQLLPAFRFTNTVVKKSWSSEDIAYVTIDLSESITIENRGGYYDRYGALKDIVQNHLLQILALITLDQPENLHCLSLAQAKAHILEKTMITDGLLGQYQGYRKEPKVSPDSTTETFAILKATVNTPTWQGVPFFLKTGKALDKHTVSIKIYYKPTLYNNKKYPPNTLTITIEPEAGITLFLNGNQDPINLTYFLERQEKFSPHERLLNSVLQNDQCTSVSKQEIACAWKIIDQVKTLHLPLYYYPIGSHGPQEIQQWLANNLKQ